jgi:hypothetical protein
MATYWGMPRLFLPDQKDSQASKLKNAIIDIYRKNTNDRFNVRNMLDPDQQESLG